MMEEQDAPFQEQSRVSDVLDQVDAAKKSGSESQVNNVLDQADDISARTDPQINFAIQAGEKIDGDRAKRILNVKRRLSDSTPVPFIDRNLDYLEQETAKQDFKADFFLNHDDRLKSWVTENAPKAALIRSNPDEMQKLGLMKILLERPPALWPLSEQSIQADARRIAQLRAEKAWNANERINYKALQGVEGEPAIEYSSQKQMEEAYYEQELEKRRNIESIIRGHKEMGFVETMVGKHPEAPWFANMMSAIPWASHLISMGDKIGMMEAAKRLKNGSTDEVDRDSAMQAARLEAVMQMRGKSLFANIGEQGATLLPAITEMAGGARLGAAVGERFLGEGAKGITSWLLESGVGAMTAGLPNAAETWMQRATPAGALGEDKDGKLVYKITGDKGEPLYVSIPKAGLSSFADYFAAKAFGPWFTKASPVEQALAKQSIVMAFPKEAFKFVGMSEGANLIRGLGGVQSLEAPDIVKAISGDAEAGKRVGAQILWGGGLGVAHAAAQNLRADTFRTKLEDIAAQHQAEGLDVLGKLVQDSKVLTETPEEGKDFVKRFAADGPHEHVFRPIQSWDEYWSAKNISPREAARAVNGETDSYDQAKRAGPNALFQMRMGDYVEKIAANEEHSKDFAKNSTLDPSIPTAERAKENTKAAEKRQPLMPEEFLAAQGKPYSDLWFLGMKGEKAEKANKVLNDAYGAGLEQVKAEEIAKRQRAQDKELNALREQVRPQVEEMVNARPEVKALERLKNEGPEFKLDRADIESEFGKGAEDVLPKGIVRKEGVHPDDAAEALGFNSGKELLAALAQSVVHGKEDIVKQEIDRLIMETRPELLRPPELSQADIEDLKGNQHSRLLEMQRQHLLSEDYATFKGLVKAVQRQPRSLQSYRDTAVAEIGAKNIRDIIPAKYKADMESSRKEAEDAILKGDVETAVDAKERELDSYEHYRAALERQQEIKAAINFGKRIQTKEFQAELGKADPENLKQLLAILSRFELAKVPESVIESRKMLAEFIKEKQDNIGEIISTPDWLLNEAAKVNYKDMTADQFREVMTKIKELYTMAVNENKLIAGEKKLEWQENEGALADEVTKDRKQLPPEPTRSAATLWDKVKNVARRADASLIKVEQFLKEMTNGDITAKWMDLFWHPLADAQVREYDYNEKITGKIAQSIEEMPPEVRRGLREIVQFKGARRMTRLDLIGLGLNAGNESNLSKTKRGEAMRTSGGLTEAQIHEALNMLRHEEIDYINKIHKILESMKGDISALHQELTGLPMEEVKPRALKLDGGTIEGGYYPMIYDYAASTRGAEQFEAKVGDFITSGHRSATLGWGHRQSRAEGFAAPVDFDVQNLPSHIAGVVKDITHRRWLIDANKILSSKLISEAIKSTYGDPMYQRLRELVKEVVNDRNQASLPSLSVWRKLITGFRTNTAIAATGLKLGVMLEHTAGVGAAIDHIGLDYFRQGVGEMLQNPKQAFKEMTTKSGEMRHFLETGNRDLRDKLRELEGKHGFVADIQRTAAYAIGYANMARALPVWWGAYRKAMAELPTSKGLSGAELEKYAVYSADQAVRLTVGTAGAKDLTAVQSGARGGDLMKLFTMFYTPGAILYQNLHDIGHEAGRTKDIPHALVRAFWVLPFAAAMQAIVKGHYPHKDKDETWGGWWLKTQASYPFSAVPILRDIAGTAIYGRESGFDTPGTKAMQQILDSADFAKRGLEGEATWREAAKKAHDAVNHFMGIPDQQLWSIGDYLLDIQKGETHSNDIFELYRDLLHYHHKR